MNGRVLRRRKDKLTQLAKKINLSDRNILNELVGIYPKHGKIDFTIELSQNSDRPDYYLEIVFSSLLNEGKKEEAVKILDLVSAAKRRDLEFFIQ